MKPALSRPKARAALMQELEYAVRKSSALGVIFGQTVANRVGVSSSDLECLDFLNIEGRVTAGRLAELTGLTTGAITGVIDRLESAGLAYRERDPHDRRRVVVTAAPSAHARVAPLFEGLGRAALKLASRYDDRELEVIERYLVDCLEMMTEETKRLQAERSRAQFSSSNSSSSGGPTRVGGRSASR